MMPVYVDQPMTWSKRFPNYCHMFAESLEELHAMAHRIGLKREWFQDDPDHPHYDISPTKRKLALRYGATVMMPAEYAVWIAKQRAARKSNV